ncbi:MAG: tetratricopeptide repeat protein [Gemmatimonadetes bacterium]|nr:tetratricopeptide repeat protein [Gemmatimonadota bacterium]
MNPEQWERIQNAFHEALALPADARAAYLDKTLGDSSELRAEVDALLATYETEPSFLEDSPVQREDTAAPEAVPAPSRSGTSIDAWNIAERIGEGGMGTVWRAERSGDFEQQAALKIVKRGMDSEHVVARFRAERRILASLDHPDIARLYDGGITGDGLPYFVMELIEGGTPIERYCLENDLPLRDRLVLFTRVCSAVHYAHQNLVVHRDLKPSNILISRAGDVKLLDFGIAKLLDTDGDDDESPMTRTDMRLLTPEYTSPEQFRGEPVTTGADVYSLGLLLYEMLTGAKGHALANRSVTEMARVVCEDDPPRPSARVRAETGTSLHEGAVSGQRLRGDLDNIVMKAIRKEPADRYASAKALADDIGRFLDHEPITARPQTVRYQFGKFVRRHRFGTVAAALSLLLVVGFGAAMAVQSARIAKQARQIALERDKAQEVATFLQELFAVAAPTQSRGETVTARELLDRGSARLASELESDPNLQSGMMQIVGEVYTNLALFPQAESLLTRALTITQGDWPGAEANKAATLHSLAKLRFTEAKPLEADSLFALAVAAAEDVWGRDHLETARYFDDYAKLKSELGELDRADSLHREALGIFEAEYGRRSVETADILSNLASNLRLLDRLDEAETLEREAYAIRREEFGEPHTAVAASITNLAWVARARGEYAEAESLSRVALAQHRVLYPDNHPNIANAMTNLAGILQQNQKWDEAVSIYKDCREMVREVYGEESAQYVRHLNNLATLYIRQQQYAEADTTYRALLPLLDRQLGPRHPVTTSVRANYSQVLAGFGDFEGAARILHGVLEIEIERYGEEHSEVASTMSTLSTYYMDRGDLASALPLAKRALAIRRVILPEGHPDLANSLINVGYAYGTEAAGEEYYAEAADVLRAAYGADDIRTVRGETSFARYYLRREQWAEAEAILERGVVIADKQNDPDHWLNQWIYECLAEAHRAQGNERLAQSYEAKVIDG